ncbi:Hsp70 family protein [Actibacterium lipolyticum]|uniref:Chaperone protein DnaK n=1 Tax=Actibacterium lipolyticum TaxID=1524263 RepID=A0A238JLP5_9RHOB|nr:Hsp70 family protein [Actibacterium lipolyticum]SMX31114.1 Chaperone protein DnaK [Actibacterium lipolyticum]
MVTHSHALGIDFGTSNSAAAYLRDGMPRLVEMAPGQTTLPTTFFFDYETRQTLMGEPANQALLNGEDGRFMRALKRVLGTTLMHEKRQVLNQRVTCVEIIARFLAQIKTRAEADAGLTFDRAVSGRPVVFHGVDDPREEQAEADLKACYLAAGFKEVEFVPEPEAAAIASGTLEQMGEIGLIVDIGGGTSDFSLFRSGADGIEILANHGVRIGGTDFDRTINIDRVMPLLGKGTQLRKVLGPGETPMPNAIFNDLATWEKIPFLYTARNRRAVEELARLAYEPEKLNRLVSVLEDELGHELAFAVERGKIAANSGDEQSRIVLEQIERDLAAPLPTAALAPILDAHAQALRIGAQETLARAGLEIAQVNRVIYVGGSSLMSIVSDTMKVQFPDAQHSFTEVFTAVTNGLALASARR